MVIFYIFLNFRYKLRLEVKQNLFVVKMDLETSNTDYMNLPVVLKGEDLYLKSGNIALFTDNASGSYFD